MRAHPTWSPGLKMSTLQGNEAISVVIAQKSRAQSGQPQTKPGQPPTDVRSQAVASTSREFKTGGTTWVL